VPAGERLRQAHEQVLHVPAIAEDGVGEAGGLDRLFRSQMIALEGDLRIFRLRHGGVEDAPDARGLGGCNGGAVLCKPLARGAEFVGGDDQEPVDCGKRGLEGGPVVEIDATCFDAEGRQVGEPGGVAAAGDDVRGAQLPAFDQMLDDEAAEMAGGAGDEDLAHGLSFGDGGRRRRTNSCSQNESCTKMEIDRRL